LKDASIGAAATSSEVLEGLFGIRGRTVGSATTFPAYFVNGNRRRTGVEFSWMPGPFSIKSEFIDMREQRLKQSLRREDLPDMIQRGWYLSGTWVVTGQNKARGLDRGRYIPFLKRWGSVEVAARYEAIRLASDTGTGLSSRSTRAFNATRQSDRVWTFGANWYLTQWVKLQANFIRDRLEDPFRAPIQGVPSYWLYKFRMQFVL
jgi:phosphate-selective porin OprO and OprP